MKKTIQFEELAWLGLGIYLFSLQPYSWGLFLVLFFVPDIGMLGYVVNSKIGAWTYNLFHHSGLAIGIYILGIYLENYILQLSGSILFAHIAFDRMLGYGLKLEKGFKFTHLGQLGKKN